MAESEKKIETAILDWLNAQPGCFAFKVNTGGIFDPRTRRFRKNANPHCHNGTSDILGVWRGRMMAIEVKRPKTLYGPKTYPSALQKYFIERIRDSGGIGFVARSLQDVQDYFTSSLFNEDLTLPSHPAESANE